MPSEEFNRTVFPSDCRRRLMNVTIWDQVGDLAWSRQSKRDRAFAQRFEELYCISDVIGDALNGDRTTMSRSGSTTVIVHSESVVDFRSIIRCSKTPITT